MRDFGSICGQTLTGMSVNVIASIEQFCDLDRMLFEEAVGRLKAYEELFGTGGNGDAQLLLTQAEWECKAPKRKEEAHLTQADDTEPALLLAELEEVVPATLERQEWQERQEAVMLNEEQVWPELHGTEHGKETTDIWYLDNSASNHMTRDRVKFRELDEAITGKVKFGDGSSVQIIGKGSILFRCKNDDQWLLNEVYYIPRLRSNIVSLGQLTEAGHKVVMDEDELEVFVKNPWLLIMNVRRTPNRLCRIELQIARPVCLLANLEDPSWLWHARLVHVNFQAMKMLVNKKMATGVPPDHSSRSVMSRVFGGEADEIVVPVGSQLSSEGATRTHAR
ncbi:uncharacterized protein LOC116257672 [Nymphaea colorata]|uniref:uncharacterized protein LOC116257672 n=1 Tax=Nymphaea colorata TaxID=210225 RepID=UPI00129E9949|nr:uncharacterized protein LOC116257672 [Nymphaea colorata]